MFLFQSGHSEELKEALSAGLPVYFAAITISVFLVVLAAIPPSVLPASSLRKIAWACQREALGNVCVAVMVTGWRG